MTNKTFFILMVAYGVFITPVASRADEPAFKKIMIVIFENEDFGNAMSEPAFAKFAQGGANLTQFYAETHPSQGNYIALTSGDLNGVKGDGNYDLDVRHVGDLLEEKGLNWKVYAEAYPGDCFLKKKSGTFVRKHTPFLSYTNVQNSPERCARIVEAGELQADIAAGTLPDYSLYIPDMNNDGHDTGVAYAGKWFGKFITPLLTDRKFMDGMLVVATFDEGSLFGSNQIYTALFGDSVSPGSESKTKYNHYSLLRLVEDMFGLGDLGKKDKTAKPITGIWK